uniref:Uncharacterized protein n=1 Tax=Ciona savignyi TaxID=51511 RepID=H2ZAS4_CIOSA
MRVMGGECFGSMSNSFKTLNLDSCLHQSFEKFAIFDVFNQSWARHDWATYQTDKLEPLKLKLKFPDTIQVTEVINVPITQRYYVIILIETEQ